MPGTKTRNTMGEVLQGILQDLSQAKTLPDADLEFLINLETNILAKLRQPMEQMMGQLEGTSPPSGAPPLASGGGAPPPMGPEMAGMPGMAPGMVPGMPGMPPGPEGMGAPQRVPGIMNGPNLPNPDELRRMLTQ